MDERRHVGHDNSRGNLYLHADQSLSASFNAGIVTRKPGNDFPAVECTVPGKTPHLGYILAMPIIIASWVKKEVKTLCRRQCNERRKVRNQDRNFKRRCAASDGRYGRLWEIEFH